MFQVFELNYDNYSLYFFQNKTEAEQSSSDEDDMEKAIAKEKSEIVKAACTPKRFQNTDTKFKNLVFIRTTLEDPSELAYKMFSDMFENQTQKARYALRMIPVTAVCKSKNMEPVLKEMLKPHFETPFGVGLRFTSMCKIRNNQSVQRLAVLSLIHRLIQEFNPLHKLCHDDSQLVVIVEVIRNNCCLGIVKDYFKFKKYNFQQVATTVEADSGAKELDASKEKEIDSVEEQVGSIDKGKDEPDSDKKVAVEMNEDIVREAGDRLKDSVDVAVIEADEGNGDKGTEKGSKDECVVPEEKNNEPSEKNTDEKSEETGEIKNETEPIMVDNTVPE